MVGDYEKQVVWLELVRLFWMTSNAPVFGRELPVDVRRRHCEAFEDDLERSSAGGQAHEAPAPITQEAKPPTLGRARKALMR